MMASCATIGTVDAVLFIHVCMPIKISSIYASTLQEAKSIYQFTVPKCDSLHVSQKGEHSLMK